MQILRNPSNHSKWIAISESTKLNEIFNVGSGTLKSCDECVFFHFFAVFIANETQISIALQMEDNNNVETTCTSLKCFDCSLAFFPLDSRVRVVYRRFSIFFFVSSFLFSPKWRPLKQSRSNDPERPANLFQNNGRRPFSISRNWICTPSTRIYCQHTHIEMVSVRSSASISSSLVLIWRCV